MLYDEQTPTGCEATVGVLALPQTPTAPFFMPNDQTPAEANGPNAATELQQLEAALRTGAITPELFATLAASLGPAAAAQPLAPAPGTGGAPAAPNENAGLPSLISLFENAPSAAPAPPPAAPAAPRPAPAFLPPPPESRPAPAPVPEFLPPRPAAGLAAAPAPAPWPAAPQPPAAAKPAAPERSGLSAALAVLGVLALLALAYYLYQNNQREDEHLTSTSITAADAVAVAEEPEPAATSDDLPAASEAAPAPVAPAPAPAPSSTLATTDSTATAPVSSPTAPVANAPAATPTAASTDAPTAAAGPPPAPVPAAPEPDDDEATGRVREALAAYYADLMAPPFDAAAHFAPQVERYITLTQQTPASIGAWLARNRFPDIINGQLWVEPGTLKVSSVGRDGSRVATYVEQSVTFRPSLSSRQRVRARLRVRFDADYKIVFKRSDHLISSTLE